MLSFVPVEKFYQTLEAPFGKEMVWYENRHTMFHPDDAKAIEKFLTDYMNKSTEVLL